MSAALSPTELSRRGQPRSRTWQLTAYQAVPFTGWVVARGCGWSRTGKALKIAQVQAEFRRQSDCASSEHGGQALT
jgi:hypothetical protein